MRKKALFIFLMSVFLLSTALFAQEPYKLPPKEIVDIVDAPPPPRAMMNPPGDIMLLAEYESLPSIAYLSQPLLRLAGTRITPKYNSRQQTMFYTGLVLKFIKTGETKRIALPDGAKLGFPRWSNDGKRLAFTRSFLLWRNIDNR